MYAAHMRAVPRPDHARVAHTLLLAVISLLAALPARADLRSDVGALLGANEVVYAVGANDTVLLDINGDRPFVPASTLKVFTTLLAAEHLGLDMRFGTEVYQAGDRLIVRGTGDPYLVSEELDRLAGELETRLDGRTYDGIVIDDSFFAPGISIPGVGGSDNPYDAPNSATAVNFNTINVRRSGTKIVSAEAQTPLTPLAESLAQRHKIESALRINLGGHGDEAARYAGELIAAKLRTHGIAIHERVSEGKAPAQPPLYVHHNTRTLGEVCREMLYYSNNFVANQIFLAIGAHVAGPPASLEKSVAVAQRYVAAHPQLRGITVTEGSGLSYDDRVTAPAMAALLRMFVPYRYLLKEKDGVSHKTGTLQITKTLVGYLDTPAHGTVRFVIALEGAKSDRRWDIVEALRREL
jgi:D-alanyl-D-alanine carboxypeptidase/D-alanyl-D-alanine-endopeptidase (penicillin-binding protein 4)